MRRVIAYRPPSSLVLVLLLLVAPGGARADVVGHH
jgi:hypothetical protein